MTLSNCTCIVSENGNVSCCCPGHEEWQITFEQDCATYVAERQHVKRIRVSKETIAANKEKGTHDPAVYLNVKGEVILCHEVAIEGPSRLIQRKNHIWIETEAPIQIYIERSDMVFQYELPEDLPTLAACAAGAAGGTK